MIDLTLQAAPRPWGTNQDRNLHPKERAKLILQWKTLAETEYANWRRRNRVAKHSLKGRAVVTVAIPFPHRRRRDPHNYCGTVVKAIIDGLVKGGLAPDDTHEYVEHREPVLFVNKTEKPHIRIEIEEAQDDVRRTWWV